MRRYFALLLFLCVFCLLIVGCVNSDTSRSGMDSGVVDIVAAVGPPQLGDMNPDTTDNTAAADASQLSGNDSETQNDSAIDDAAASAGGDLETKKSIEVGADGIDYDLTKLNSTMAYAQISNILASPDGYFGKIIKVSGLYCSTFFDQTDMRYHLVGVGDETSCCQQWLEFVWSGKHNYPEDYPDEMAKIEVVGEFGAYEELGNQYYNLTVDDITIVG